MRFRSVLSATALAASVMLAAPIAKAAENDVIFALPANTLTFTSVYVANDAGYFKDEGLNVEFRLLVGVASNNAVIGGSADFSVGTAATFLRAAAQGQRMFAIANMVNKPLVELVLGKKAAEAAGITSSTPMSERAKALKGKTIAVQGIGSIVHAMQRLVSNMGGLDPDKDVRVAPMSPPAMLPALRAGKVDGYATSLPFTTQSVMEGDAIMLASGPSGDLPEFIPFSYLVLYTRPEVCKERREMCAKMGRAFQKAAKFIHDRPDDVLKFLEKRFSKLPPELLAAAWKTVRVAHAEDIRITTPGFDNAQKFNLDAGLLDAKLELKSYDGLYTNDFAK